MNPRFKHLYGKPKTLTDRYDECREVDIARVLHKPEAELRWDDFNLLFRVGVASASYEEGVYFLTAAFAFLRRHPNPDAVHCIADVIWYVSEHAARLEQDGLLEECREQVLAMLHERTAQFVVVHWDREKNRQMGFDREHRDYVPLRPGKPRCLPERRRTRYAADAAARRRRPLSVLRYCFCAVSFWARRARRRHGVLQYLSPR